MGYNITVYCRCFEEGLTNEPPIPRSHIKRDTYDGYLIRVGITSSSLKEDLEFDEWAFNSCKHEDGELFEGHLGNMATVGHFRACLKKHSIQKFPSLWKMFVENSQGNFPYEDTAKAIGEISEFRLSAEFDEYCEYTANNLEAALNIAVPKKLPIHIT